MNDGGSKGQGWRGTIRRMKAVRLGEGIIGHGVILRLLETWSQVPAPAYLLVGAAGLGKRTIAERFIQALLDQPQAQLNLAHPDLMVLEAEEGKMMVSVEAVRDVRLRLAERPMVAARRVVFIPSLDRLNEAGTNALLKVFEEPPAGAVFVCVAQDLSRIPATIQSRVVKVPFSPVPRAEIVAGLRERGIEMTEAERRALASRGRPGLALSVAEPSPSASFATQFLGASSVGERLSLIEALAKDCESSDNSADAWSLALDEWGDVFRRALSSQPLIALIAGQGVVTAKRFVGGALSPRLPLEAAALRLASSHPLKNLFPSALPSPYPAIFSF